MEPTVYTCDGDDWNPPFSSDFISNACTLRPEMCSVNGTINNIYIFNCTGEANDRMQSCLVRCKEGYHYLSLTVNIPTSIAPTCDESTWNIEASISEHIDKEQFRCAPIKSDCNCSAKSYDDDKALLRGQLISASGDVKGASEQENLPVWITAGVSAGLMIIISIVILYVARRRKHPSDDNPPPRSANESAATPDMAI